MQNKPAYSNLVYDYFRTRFQFQYFRAGENLPPIDSLCQEFGVTDGIVKRGLRRLRAEGYISMRNGRPTKVLHSQTREETNRLLLRFFSERWPAFLDVDRSMEIMLRPLAMKGFRQMAPQEFEDLAALARRGAVEEMMLFYCAAFQKTGNALAMNLFWEANLFLGLPLMRRNQNPEFYNEAFISSNVRELISRGAAQDWQGLQGVLSTYQRGFLDKAFDRIGKHIFPVPPEEQVTFNWRIYREHPQICYSLAVRIMHEINWGVYMDQDFLPSYARMAALYGVPLITMRRTIAMLNSTGAVHTINGKGTRIFPVGRGCGETDFSNAAVRRNLAHFAHAFELVASSCEPAGLMTLKALTAQQKKDLAAQLEGYLHSGCCDRALWSFLICIASHCPLQGLRGIYGKLYGLFLWGYPLKAFSGNPAWLDRAQERFSKVASQALRAGGDALCAVAFRELVEEELPIMRQYLLRQGLRPEELCPPPAMRVLQGDAAPTAGPAEN